MPSQKLTEPKGKGEDDDKVELSCPPTLAPLPSPSPCPPIATDITTRK